MIFIGSKLVENIPISEIVCPNCKKKIEPRFSIKEQTGVVVGAAYEYIKLIGCPECKNVFYEDVESLFSKK